MAWILLIIAGVGECFWSSMMKLSNGFSHIGYTIATLIGMVFSFVALVMATKTLPLSLAYPIWTGIGAVGAVIIGTVFFKDHINPLTWIFVILLLVSIIGIKITAGE
ncbi:MAG: DMT family transporter [Ruminococcus sp.]|jgi:quaternary ammonium compound-resistance protein SugE